MLRALPRRIAKAFALIALSVTGMAVPAPAAAAAATPAGWELTGDMARARGFAPLVALGDGTVITAGGTDGPSYTAAAERWAAGSWSAAGSIGQAVAGQVAALLPDGKALFAGGAGMTSYYTYGDLFDPVSGTWTQTPAMAHAHAYGVAAQLQSGDIMVIGGYDGGTTLTTGAVDIYSASAGTWSAAKPLPEARYAFTATTLADGRVLVAGGDTGTLAPGSALSSVRIYDPASDTWTAAESMSKVRVDAAAALLSDGRVLVAGGTDAGGAALNTAEVYDPATGHWTTTGFMTSVRAGFTLTTLLDGRLIAAAGFGTSPTQALNTSDLYDPTTGGWTGSGKLWSARRYHSAVRLADGSVLVAGGHGSGSSFISSAEVYTPPPGRLTYPHTTFHPLPPARLLDTRVNNGLNGYFYPASPRRFQVTGRGGVPADAIAVTGILTTTKSTALGYLTIGPVFTAAPSTSSLNFPSMDDRANNVTTPLDEDGMLSVVYIGKGKTHAVFDVTGYFTADSSGATYVPLALPTRILDSRDGTGLSGKFVSEVTRSFQVVGRGGVPAGALAVTGNFTLVRPTSRGWAFIGPSVTANPRENNSSTVNAPPGDTRANGVTAKLAENGTLSVVWCGTRGSTADLLFDVTGYYVAGSSGAVFVPLEPTRVVDSRINLPFLGPTTTRTQVRIQMAGRAGIPVDANGIAGNLTVTGQTYLGYLTVAPQLTPGVTPGFSTLNFPKGDNRANGFNVSLGPGGTIDVVYEATASGSRTYIVIDVVGYFLPPPSS
jgi:hypothetical protein